MMSEGGEGHIVSGNDAKLIPVGSGSVGLSVDLEGGRSSSEEAVNHGVEAGLPCLGDSASGPLVDGLDVSLGHGINLTVVGKGLLAGHGRLGNDTVIFNHMEHIISLRSGPETKISIKTDIFVSPVFVRLGNDKHLGEIRILRRVLDTLDPDDLGLKESYGREAPACA